MPMHIYMQSSVTCTGFAYLDAFYSLEMNQVG